MSKKQDALVVRRRQDGWFRGAMLALPLLMALLMLLQAGMNDAYGQSSVRPPDSATSNATPEAPVGGAVPGNSLGTASDSEKWRAIRQGVQGTVSIADEKAGVLVQSAGENFRLVRNGELFGNLGKAIIATVLLLALFYAFRGRIRIEHGWSGKKILRFNTVERMGHWILAVSFIILAITGLNVTFGKTLVMPLIGKEAFGPLSGFLKYVHNYVAFAFMLGLAITFVAWVVHNFPNRHDLVWLAKAGGLFTKNSHPPAKKFNAGQKLIFWTVMLGGLSLSLSGWALMYPFEYNFFTETFVSLSAIGIDIPGWLGMAEPPYTAIQEQQYNSIWHAIVAVVMFCIILAHIYIGSVGMEGAFDAMGSGEVDLNWAKEHHSLWVEEVQAAEASKEVKGGSVQPAE